MSRLLTTAPVALQNRRIDQIRLKDADIDAGVSAGGIPRPGSHAGAFGTFQIDSQVAGRQQSIGVFRIDQRRERKIGRGSGARVWQSPACFRLNLSGLTVHVSHEM